MTAHNRNYAAMKGAALPLAANAVEGISVEATNLRRSREESEVWLRRGMPRRVDSPGALPFLSFEPYGDGRRLELLCDADNRLYYSVDGATPIGLGMLPAEPVLSLTDAEGVIVLRLNHQSDHYLTYDADLQVTLHGPTPELPAILLASTGYNSLYGTVGALALSGTSPGTSGSQLVDADASKLGKALCATYKALEGRARSTGYAVQPMPVRCRLLDARGTTLAVGPTVMLGCVDGVSGADGIVQTSADSMATLSSATMKLDVYHPALIVPAPLAAPWDRLVASLVIETSGEIAPLDESAGLPHAVHRDAVSGQVAVTSRLPGFALGNVADEGRFRRLGREALSRPMYELARYDFPFGGGLAGEPGEMLMIELGRTSSISGSSSSSGISGISSSSSPSGFISPGAVTPPALCSAALVDGDITLLCNPLTPGTKGWDPREFIATRENSPNGEWQMAVTATILTPAGERKVTAACSAKGYRPLNLSPVLSFPSASATTLTIAIRTSQGASFRTSVSLTPLAGTDVAVYVADGLKRIVPEQVETVMVPAESVGPARVRRGEAVAVASADNGRIISRRQISAGAIVRAAVAPRSSGGWDFSRRKVMFFCEDGMTLATLDGAGKFQSSAPVDFRGIRSARAVTPFALTRGAALGVIAGGDLVAVSGQKVETVMRDIGRYFPAGADLCLGYNQAEGELVVADDSGRLLRVASDGEVTTTTIPGFTGAGPLRLLTAGDRLLCASTRQVYDLSAEDAATLLDVELKCRHSLNFRPELVMLNLFASEANGSVSLLGDRGTGVAEPLVRFDITGEVNAPLPLRIPPLARRFVTLHYRLAASADLSIRPAEIHPVGSVFKCAPTEKNNSNNYRHLL